MKSSSANEKSGIDGGPADSIITESRGERIANEE